VYPFSVYPFSVYPFSVYPFFRVPRFRVPALAVYPFPPWTRYHQSFAHGGCPLSR
jgi:hypothetical protein